MSIDEISRGSIDVVVEDIEDEGIRKIHAARYSQAIYEFISDIAKRIDIGDLIKRYNLRKVKGELGGYRLVIDFPKKRPFPAVTLQDVEIYAKVQAQESVVLQPGEETIIESADGISLEIKEDGSSIVSPLNLSVEEKQKLSEEAEVIENPEAVDLVADMQVEGSMIAEVPEEPEVATAE